VPEEQQLIHPFFCCFILSLTWVFCICQPTFVAIWFSWKGRPLCSYTVRPFWRCQRWIISWGLRFSWEGILIAMIWRELWCLDIILQIFDVEKSIVFFTIHNFWLIRLTFSLIPIVTCSFTLCSKVSFQDTLFSIKISFIFEKVWAKSDRAFPHSCIIILSIFCSKQPFISQVSRLHLLIHIFLSRYNHIYIFCCRYLRSQIVPILYDFCFGVTFEFVKILWKMHIKLVDSAMMGLCIKLFEYRFNSSYFSLYFLSFSLKTWLFTIFQMSKEGFEIQKQKMRLLFQTSACF
jgi:hypothetical protein